MQPDTLFAHTLLSWYRQHKRELPWRGIDDPYRIWLSEIILQQTRIAQGKDYYLRFVREFPDVESLAAAPEDKVMKMWEGLGYYSRARNLHQAAKQVVEKGHFPQTLEEVRTLKGVGDYTAAAICSMAYNIPVAALDGNAYRVFGRIFSIEQPFDSREGKIIFKELAESLLDKEHPGEFNQAVMDFGAIQCTPRNPACDACPFTVKCGAHAEKREEYYPVRSKRPEIKERHLNYFFILHNNKILIHKRTLSDIWKGMYEPYLVETPDRQDLHTIEDNFLQEVWAEGGVIKAMLKDFRHLLTHRRLWLNGYLVQLQTELPPSAKGYKFIPVSDLQTLAIPTPILRMARKLLGQEPE